MSGVNGEPVHIGKERFAFHQTGWGNWYCEPDKYRVGRQPSYRALKRAIAKAQEKGKADSKGGAGKSASGGSFLADLFGLGTASSAHTVKPKGAKKVKPPKGPWWDLTGDHAKAQAKKDEKAKAPWWMLG